MPTSQHRSGVGPDSAAAAESVMRVSGSRVEVSVPADPAWLSPLRTVTAKVTSRAEFDTETAVEMRLAVEEACTLLISCALPGTELSVRFDPARSTLRLRAEVVGAVLTRLRTDTFGWQILRALTDTLDTSAIPEVRSVDEFDAAPLPVVSIELSRSARLTGARP